MGFHLILLLWLIQAAASQESNEFGCIEKCGNITIPSPFGIESRCYRNPWFKVSCNETVDGPKAFINRIGMELLGSYSDNSVVVNSSVTYHNCSNKFNNSNGVNLEGSPFFFSFRLNTFGSLGCGNLVSLVDDNKTVVSSCIQPSCGDPLTLSYNKGCFAFFSENRTSFPATIQQFYHEDDGHSKRSSCSSTFIFDPMSLLNPDMTFPNDITSHVPATLEWTNPCDLEAAQCQEADPEPGCTKRCGNVDFEFPFGIEPGCYFNDWFRVTCKETANGQVPFLNKIDLELNSFSLFEGKVGVNHPVTYSNCHERGSDKNIGSSVDLRGSPFYFSSIFNTFVSVGCSSVATISHSHNQTDVIGGCLLPSCNLSNNNIGSCVTGIPPGITSFVANMTQINSNGIGSSNNRSCGSAFIMDTQDSLFDQHRMIIAEPDVVSRRTRSYIAAMGHNESWAM